MKDGPGYQSVIFSFCFPFSVAGSADRAPAKSRASPQSTASPTEFVSSTTEPATQSTTTKIPSTEGPDMECDVVVVGGGKIAYCCYRSKL